MDYFGIWRTSYHYFIAKSLKPTIDEKIQKQPGNVKSTNHRFAYGNIIDDFSIVLITTYKDTRKYIWI